MPTAPLPPSQYETLSDFQQSARKRLADAYELLEPPSRNRRRRTQHQDAAVYLAGYAVECALKAYLIRQLEARGISARNLVDVAWARGFNRKERQFCTHDLKGLCDAADLYARMVLDPELREDFGTCLKWSPEWRYKGRRIKTGVRPREFVDAMARVYRWIRDQAP